MDDIADKALYKQWPNIVAMAMVYLVHCFFWMHSCNYQNVSCLVGAVGLLFLEVISLVGYMSISRQK